MPRVPDKHRLSGRIVLGYNAGGGNLFANTEDNSDLGLSLPCWLVYVNNRVLRPRGYYLEGELGVDDDSAGWVAGVKGGYGIIEMRNEGCLVMHLSQECADGSTFCDQVYSNISALPDSFHSILAPMVRSHDDQRRGAKRNLHVVSFVSMYQTTRATSSRTNGMTGKTCIRLGCSNCDFASPTRLMCERDWVCNVGSKQSGSEKRQANWGSESNAASSSHLLIHKRYLATTILEMLLLASLNLALAL